MPGRQVHPKKLVGRTERYGYYVKNGRTSAILKPLANFQAHRGRLLCEQRAARFEAIARKPIALILVAATSIYALLKHVHIPYTGMHLDENTITCIFT